MKRKSKEKPPIQQCKLHFSSSPKESSEFSFFLIIDISNVKLSTELLIYVKITVVLVININDPSKLRIFVFVSHFLKIMVFSVTYIGSKSR